MSQQNPSSAHLDKIIQCVQETQHKSYVDISKLQNLYGEAGQLIKNFQTSINRCKRYNEAKINRKYEMIIQQLEGEVRKLNNKLKIEQDARSPTKKHVTDILDQLVAYKQENQRLRKELEVCKKSLSQLQVKSEQQVAAIKKMQNQHTRTFVQRLPALNPTDTVVDGIKQFLRDKQNVRKVVSGNQQKSNLQKFLHQNQPKAWNWTIGNLLQQLDKWSEGVKTQKQVDMWRIRSSVARSFSQYLDDSQSLVRPSSFANKFLKPISNDKKQFTYKQFNKKQSRFSILGDKRNNSVMEG